MNSQEYAAVERRVDSALLAVQELNRLVGATPRASISPYHSFTLPRKLKLLLIGHGGHGKDTVAEILRAGWGFSFSSSSEFAAKKAVYPLVADLYPDWTAAYADRRNHRELWYHAIRAYNLRPGRSLAEQILLDSDVYVGMRSRAEFDNSAHLFNYVLWVDASKRLPPEDTGSMELGPEDAQYCIDNNGPLGELRGEVDCVMQSIYDDYAEFLA